MKIIFLTFIAYLLNWGASGADSTEDAYYAMMSFNVSDDQTYLLYKCHHEFDIKSKEDEEAALATITTRRDEMFKQIFAPLDYDFYTLQEISDLERCKTWFAGKNYGFVHDHIDTCIVYNKDKFTLVEDKTESESGLFSIALLRDNTNKKLIQVFCAHLTGCHKHTPDLVEAEVGNKQLEQLLLNINEAAAMNVLGADFNTSPNYKYRQQIATDLGFMTDDYDDGKGTIFDGSKIDYIRARNGSGHSVEVQDSSVPQKLPGDANNPSDHRYIVKRFKVSENQSLCTIM